MESRQRIVSRRAFAKGLIAAPAALSVGRSQRMARAQGATTVTFWQFSTNDFEIQAYNDAIAAFSEQNPDITVNMEIVPWPEQQQKLVTGLTTGACPTSRCSATTSSPSSRPSALLSH